MVSDSEGPIERTPAEREDVNFADTRRDHDSD